QRAMDAGLNHAYRDEAAQTGRDEFELTMAKAAPEVQRQLDELLAPPPPHEVKWGGYFVLYGLVVALPFAAMLLVYRRRKREYSYRPREIAAALFFASPWIA